MSDTKVQDPLPGEVDELSAAVARYAEDPDGYEGEEVHYNSVLIGVEIDVGGFKRMQYPASRSELMDLVGAMPLVERANLDHYAPTLMAALEYVLMDDELDQEDSGLAVYSEIISDEELMDFVQGSVAQNYLDLRRMYPVLTDLAEQRGFFDDYCLHFEGNGCESMDPDEEVDDRYELDLANPFTVTNVDLIDFITRTGIQDLKEFADVYPDVYGLAQTRHVVRRENLEKVPLANAVFEEMTEQNADFATE
ncbi:hypothetical protein HOD38_00265 [archaeon]|jgi:hypothetical protein|nr:hypothetical protein [archaeon]MBT4396680.1 hypothetical protein [archaeon]MBT4441290.1 hypothetical protein [archaeon]